MTPQDFLYYYQTILIGIIRLVALIYTHAAVSSSNCPEIATVQSIVPLQQISSKTFLNTGSPISCNGILHRWNYCNYAERTNTYSMTVALWSYKEREGVYVVNSNSIHRITQRNKNPYSTSCFVSPVTNYVLVSEGDIIGVSFPISFPFPVIHTEKCLNSNLSFVNASRPSNISDSELVLVSQVALQIFASFNSTLPTSTASTTLPVQTTTLVVETSSLPVESTSFPVKTTSLPVESTNPPVDSTNTSGTMNTNKPTSPYYLPTSAPHNENKNITFTSGSTTNSQQVHETADDGSTNSTSEENTATFTNLLVILLPTILVAMLVATLTIVAVLLLCIKRKNLHRKSKVTLSATNSHYDSKRYTLSAEYMNGDIQNSQDVEYDYPIITSSSVDPRHSSTNLEKRIVTTPNVAYNSTRMKNKSSQDDLSSSMIDNVLYGGGRNLVSVTDDVLYDNCDLENMADGALYENHHHHHNKH